MDDHQKALLEKLLSTPGPSGFEQNVARIWRDEAVTFADHVDHDVIGNSRAHIGKDRTPLVLIEGHIDEIGLVVTHIDDDGFIWFEKIGG